MELKLCDLCIVIVFRVPSKYCRTHSASTLQPGLYSVAEMALSNGGVGAEGLLAAQSVLAAPSDQV